MDYRTPKKQGSAILDTAAFLLGFEQFLKTAAKMHRSRVELVAVDAEGKVLGGVYSDGSFGLPGGGVNPDESLEAAARREALEEMGYTVTGIKPLPVSSITVKWDKDEAPDPWAEALADEYRGSRTYFVMGKVQPGKVKPKDSAGFKNIKLYPIAEAIEIQQKTVDKGKSLYLAEAKKRLQALKEAARQLEIA